MNDEKMFNSECPMALVETPSIFNTTIAINYLIGTSDDDEKTQLLQFELDCIIGDILAMYSRYIFEKELFELRQQKVLTASELNDLMACAQKQAFGDSLDKKFLNPYIWITKSQFFDSENNFYNFPYIFGDLLSIGLYAMYLDKGNEFVNKYDEFLSSTGKGDFQGILKKVNIDLNDSGFWTQTYKIIDDMINEYSILTEVSL
jgi:oligoendopeptidase F